MNDLDIRQDIIDELEFEPSVHAAHIGVSVTHGIARLSGHVGSYAEKLAAEHVAMRVRGVRGVAEEIEIRYPEGKKSSDDEIADRALKIIDWDVAVPPDSVKVQVSKGCVTLLGQVDWNYQRAAAAEAVRKLTGVTAIINSISVKPRAEPGEIKRRLEEAFTRNAAIDAKGIKVSVKDGKVTLEGRVHGWQERSAAETAAWAAPGVTDVDDRLQLI
jgi:osmotically-inducible protein OsmY